MKRFTIRYLYICLAALFVVFSWENATTRGSARAQQSESAKIGRVFKGDSNKPKPENRQSVRAEVQNKDSSKGTPDVAADRAEINFTELADEKRPESAKANNRQIHIHPPNPKHLINSLRRTVQRAGPTPQQTTKPLDTPSPSVSASFPALGDDGTAIPPDTMGAVGPNHLMVTLNNAVAIEDRSGNRISTVSMVQFWSQFGTLDISDPRITYDPFQGRWVFTAMAQPETSGSLILVGVSQTNDPTGNWNLYKFTADPAGQLWADFPSTGFNKNWIVVQANMFTVSHPEHLTRSNIYVFDKADLYAGGVGNLTRFSRNDIGTNQAPAITYDKDLDTMYMLENLDGAQGQLQLFSITGAVGAETLTAGPVIQVSNTWDEKAPNGQDFGPEADTTAKIQLNDAEFANVFYRNGSIWAAQTVFIPSGAPTRTAVQWWELGPAGDIKQHSLIDDPAGNVFYGFPSIAANKNSDVLIGYSRFSATTFPSAAYSYRSGSDPANTMRTDTSLKKGMDIYDKTFGGPQTRWGDFSATVIDPINDLDMWTIQEYSGFGDLWGTWWGRISAAPTTTDVSVSVSTGITHLVRGNQLTYSITVKNNGPDWATDVQVANPLPPGMAFSGLFNTSFPCQQPAIGGTGTITCSVGLMQPGQQISYEVAIDTTADTGTSLTITATAAATSNDSVPSNNTSSLIVPVQVPVSLTIVSGDNQSILGFGDVAVKAVDSNGVGVPNLSIAFVITSQPGDSAEVIPHSKTTLDDGTASAQVFSGRTPGPIVISVTVPFLPPTVFHLTAAMGPKMKASLSHTGSFAVGSTGKFFLTARNIGDFPEPPHAVDFTDSLPLGVTLDSFSVSTTDYSCSFVTNLGFIICQNVNAIAPGTQAVLTINVIPDERAVPSVTNKAQLTVNFTDNGDDPSDTVAVFDIVDLSLGQNAPAVLLTNQSFNYTLTTSNLSAHPAPAVIVTDVLPAGVQFNSATPSQGSCTGTSTVNCNLGTVAPNSTATITINVTPNGSGTFINTGSVTGNVSDPNPSNNSVSATTMVGSPIPVLAGINPNSINAGNVGITLQVSGSGFNQNSVVQWNGANRSTTFVNTTQLQSSIPASDLANTGPATITVFNSPPGGGTSNGQIFTVTNPFPLIQVVSPGSVLAGGPDQSITINGTGFITSSVAFLSGQQLQTTFVSGTQIVASLPASVIAQAGVRLVTVTNPSPGGGNSNSALFLVVGLTTAQTDSKSVAGGSSDTVSALPLQADESGLSATLTNNIGDSVDITVKRYLNVSGIGNLIDAGGGFMDLKVIGADTGDVLAASFYYPSTITAPAELGLHLMYFDGSKWHQVRGSGGTLAVHDATDNLDGTVSGGRFSVTFDGTSTPKVTELTGTIFSLSPGLYGDLNKDQVINVADLIVMANMLAGNLAIDKQSADVLQDGTVNVRDLFILANFLAGNITTLPVVPTVGERTIQDLNVEGVYSNLLWLEFTVGPAGYQELDSPLRSHQYKGTLVGFVNQFPGLGP